MANILVTLEGEVINQANQGKSQVRASLKSIWPEIEHLPLEKEVKIKAENLYQKVGAPMRKNEGKQHKAFAFVHFAYAELDQIHSVKKLARMFNIDSKKIAKIIKSFSLSKIGYHPPQRFYSIKEYVQYLAQEISLNDDLLDIALHLAEEVPQKDLELIETQPDLVAGGIIVYVIKLFNDLNNIAEIGQLEDLILVNPNNIMDMVHRITVLDNQLKEPNDLNLTR